MSGLLAGISNYTALDLEVHRNAAQDLQNLLEIKALIRSRREFSPVNQEGESSFPAPARAVWEGLETTSDPDLASSIAEELTNGLGPRIQFIAPWTDERAVPKSSIDWLMSHSVMEHVDQLESTYAAIAGWLKPGGIATHLIDFQSHGLARHWNGHWALDEATWTVLRGRRPYLINRRWRGNHVEIMKHNGFEILEELHFHRDDGLPLGRLADQFADMSEEDATIAMSFVVARKRG